jgi:hypothetical protein
VTTAVWHGIGTWAADVWAAADTQRAWVTWQVGQLGVVEGDVGVVVEGLVHAAHQLVRAGDVVAKHACSQEGGRRWAKGRSTC